MPLYECRSCSVLATEKKPRCPACNSTTAGHGYGGAPFRRIDAAELLNTLR